MRLVETRHVDALGANGYHGILLPWTNPRFIEVVRVAPAPDLAPFIERHWCLRWNLPDGQHHVQRVAGFPCVDIVFEPDRTAVHGVIRGTLERTFRGQGRVFATKLRPGAWPTLARRAVTSLVDRAMPLSLAFDDPGADSLARAVQTASDADSQRIVEAYLRQRPPRRDARADRADRIVRRIYRTPRITHVADVCAFARIHERALQRLFRDWVGVGVKWVIRRARLQDAADRIRVQGLRPTLAHELGYVDQAHFCRDFRTLTGVSPGRYRRLPRTTR